MASEEQQLVHLIKMIREMPDNPVKAELTKIEIIDLLVQDGYVREDLQNLPNSMLRSLVKYH